MLMVRVNLIISIWWHLIFCLFDLKKKRIFHKKKNNNITIISNNKAKSSELRHTRAIGFLHKWHGFRYNNILIHKSYISSN